jgi:carbon-monoxide dehydrogenase medium subunit
MKLPQFEYEAPTSIAEAISLLAASDGSAKVLAGGQSLLPVMAFRLAAPSMLVDLKRVAGLDGIAADSTGVRLGAKVRWCDIEHDARFPAAHPLLAAAVPHIAHYQIRNRGTIGGSLAHADPAAELPGIAVSCDAEVAIAGASGTRSVRAADFFVDALTTVLSHDELIVELRLPPWKAGRRWAFQEFSMRRGDFALAGIALHYDVDGAGRATDAHIGVIGACRKPHRLAAAEAALNGRVVDEQAIRASADAAVKAVTPPSDLHAGAEYRRALVGTLLERALQEAEARK